MSAAGASAAVTLPDHGRTMVLVIGMGRSGTSALTRVLGLCGAGMPRNPLPAVSNNNDKGFWEPAPIVRAHDRILEALGTTWDGPMPPAVPVREDWAGELAGLVRAQFGAAPVMAVKDPRISRLMPLWERTADLLGVRLACVIALRHPEEVAASLARREGYPREKSVRLWNEYTLCAERATRGLPRVVVSYDALMADWRGQVERINRALGLRLDAAAGGAGVSKFLDAGLRHHRAEGVGGLDDRTCGVLRELERLAADGDADTVLLDRAYARSASESAGMRERTLRRLPPGSAMEFTGERFVPGITGEIETEHIARYLFAAPLCAGKRVLDIASGEGYGTAMLAQVASDVVGVDIDPDSVGHANRVYGRNGLRFEVGSCEQIPAKRDAFDVVVSFETIEHIEDHARFLREIRRVLRPGGILICSTPDKSVYLAGQDKNPYHKKELTGAEFEELLGSKFEHAAFFGQRLVSGSVIARGESTRTEWVGTGDGRSYERGDPMEGAVYRVAVCSDSRLPRLHGQVLSDARYSIGRVTHLSQTCSRLETEIGALGQRLKDAVSRAEKAESGVGGLTGELDRAVAVRERLDEERRSLAEDRGRLVAERRAAESERDAAIRDLATAQVDFQRAQAELERVREALMEAREKAAAAQASLAAQVSETETLRRATAQAIAGRDAAWQAQKDAEIRSVRSEEQAARAKERAASEIELARREAEQANASVRLALTQAEEAERAGRAARLELERVVRSRSWRWTAALRVMAGSGRALSLRGLNLSARVVRRLGLPGGERLAVARRTLLVKGSDLFDAAYYLRQNPDVAAAGVNPAWHFAARGGFEGRRASDRFDTAWYLAEYPDIAAAGVHPFEHYITQGVREGRLPCAPAGAVIPAAVPATPPPSAAAADPGRAPVIEVAMPAPVVAVDPERLARTKVLAFYLPQFHPIPENDAWWGKGFTEWANVTRARPMFEGHVQPVLPGELGFYDLRVPEVRERQAELARAAGIHGFCYHHYWFNGRRVLERPLEEVLASGSPDLPFCVCWANENWTRRWDGHEQEVLLRQKHTLASDRQFILDLIPYLEDPRYVRVDGKPVIVVYRAELMADPADTAAVWRDECRRAGLGEVHLCSVYLFKFDPRPLGFDASVEFPLHHFPAREITPSLRGLPEGYTGVVRDYASGVHELIRNPRKVDYRLYRGVMPSWDNTARRMERGATVYHGATPELYEAWLASAINQRHADEDRAGSVRENLVFVNAWNEWAEGAVLEPRRDLGDAYLRATARVLVGGTDRLDGARRVHLPGDGETASASDDVGNGGANDPAAGPDGPGIEDRIKRIIRRNPRIDGFVNRHPEVKARGMRLVQGISKRLEPGQRATPGPVAMGGNGVGVRWNGTASPATKGGARLLVVSHDACLAGAELILLENVAHWTRAGIDCRVLLLGPGELENAFAGLAPTVCATDLRGLNRTEVARRVVEDLASAGWRPDAAFCNTVIAAEAAEEFARQGIPVVSSVYELPTSIDDALGGRRTMERVMHASGRVIVASEFVRERLSEAYGIDAERLVPLHTGVLTRRMPERAEARREIRRELGVDEHTAVVLGCGSVHHRKGTDLFVSAAARAVAHLGPDRAVFVWIGVDQAGPTFRNWCRHDIERSGLAGQVRFLGKRHDPSAWFAGSDIFALTSREDPFPMVNLEALASGLGVVAFDGAGGAVEVLRPDRGGGVVVPYLDTDAMGSAIARLVERPEELGRLRERALSFARAHLGWDRYMGEVRTQLAMVSPVFGQDAGVRS